jgi:hypothetical protein
MRLKKVEANFERPDHSDFVDTNQVPIIRHAAPTLITARQLDLYRRVTETAKLLRFGLENNGANEELVSTVDHLEPRAIKQITSHTEQNSFGFLELRSELRNVIC